MSYNSEELSSETLKFMELALNQAKLALNALEVPICCVIIDEGKVITSGRNRTTETRNATHMLKWKLIDILLHQWRKNALSELQVTEHYANCSLYVRCEPCIMCASALSILGIKEVFYGCPKEIPTLQNLIGHWLTTSRSHKQVRFMGAYIKSLEHDKFQQDLVHVS